MVDPGGPVVSGTVEPGFEAVREEFERCFAERGEVGAAVAVHLGGVPVVDLHGGLRSPERGLPWQDDTMSIVFSVTKGVAALTMAVARSRGLFDYDRPVAEYWPEFARGGKEDITVRCLLAHRAGLPYLDVPITPELLGDHDRLADALAAQRPAWEPGSRVGYHNLTVGFYESELLRRTDREGRSLGRYFAEEVAAPLDLDFHIGLPDADPNRIADLVGGRWKDLVSDPGAVPPLHLLARLWPWSVAARTFGNPSLSRIDSLLAPDYRSVEMPNGNGIGTARAVARLYGEFASGAPVLGVDEDTLEQLRAVPEPPAGGRRDVNLKVPANLSLGQWKPSPAWRFGSGDACYGAPGAGGSFGYADPALGLGYGYVTNRLGLRIWDDPRDVALRRAVESCL